MKKLDLHQMGKDLYPSTSYKKISEMEKLLHEFWDVNAGFNINTTMLIKVLSMLMYEKSDAYYTKDNDVDVRINGIKNLLERKKEFVGRIREILEEIDADVVRLEETLGGYESEIKKSDEI